MPPELHQVQGRETCNHSQYGNYRGKRNAGKPSSTDLDKETAGRNRDGETLRHEQREPTQDRQPGECHDEWRDLLEGHEPAL